MADIPGVPAFNITDEHKHTGRSIFQVRPDRQSRARAVRICGGAMKAYFMCVLIGLSICVVPGCAAKMTVLSTPNPVMISGKAHSVIAVVTSTPVGSNFIDVFLFDPEGKLENASSTSNGGLMEGTLPSALASGLSGAANAVTSFYGVK